MRTYLSSSGKDSEAIAHMIAAAFFISVTVTISIQLTYRCKVHLQIAELQNLAKQLAKGRYQENCLQEVINARSSNSSSREHSQTTNIQDIAQRLLIKLMLKIFFLPNLSANFPTGIATRKT